jgi:mRNA capping enzyme
MNKNIEIWNQNKGEYMVFKMASPTTPEAHITLGPYAHYIGSTTREKKSGSIYQIPFAGRPVQAARCLIQLSSWLVDPTSPLKKYLKDAAASRTHIPVTLLKTTTKAITGGSVVHRLEDHVTKRDTLNNVRPNVTSHIYFSTDRMGRFSRGHDNYNLHFQGAILFGNLTNISGSLLIYCGHCCEERLPDVSISNALEPPPVPRCEGNPLLYAPMKRVGIRIATTTRSFVRFSKTENSTHAVA